MCLEEESELALATKFAAWRKLRTSPVELVAGTLSPITVMAFKSSIQQRKHCILMLERISLEETLTIFEYGPI